ncbi:hypothetical protein Tco_0702369, partial [Tanacetum coccineum]
MGPLFNYRSRPPNSFVGPVDNTDSRTIFSVHPTDTTASFSAIGSSSFLPLKIWMSKKRYQILKITRSETVITGVWYVQAYLRSLGVPDLRRTSRLTRFKDTDPKVGVDHMARFVDVAEMLDMYFQQSYVLYINVVVALLPMFDIFRKGTTWVPLLDLVPRNSWKLSLLLPMTASGCVALCDANHHRATRLGSRMLTAQRLEPTITTVEMLRNMNATVGYCNDSLPKYFLLGTAKASSELPRCLKWEVLD